MFESIQNLVDYAGGPVDDPVCETCGDDVPVEDGRVTVCDQCGDVVCTDCGEYEGRGGKHEELLCPECHLEIFPKDIVIYHRPVSQSPACVVVERTEPLLYREFRTMAAACQFVAALPHPTVDGAAAMGAYDGMIDFMRLVHAIDHAGPEQLARALDWGTATKPL